MLSSALAQSLNLQHKHCRDYILPCDYMYFNARYFPDISVRLSVKFELCKKTKETFLQHMIERLCSFFDTKNGWWFTWNFGPNWPRSRKNADFQSIFARSSSAVTTSEKSSIITNRKSITRFSMSLRWTAYVALKSSEGLKTHSGRFSSKICTIICDNFETARDRI